VASIKGEKKMTNLKNRFVTMAFAILLVTLIATSGMFSLRVNAATLPPLTSSPTYAYMDVSPDPVGVGQAIFVSAWLIEFDPMTSVDNGAVWQGYQITVTKPDNTTEILGPYAASAAASISIYYIPTQLGTYKFFFSFPGQLVSSTSVGVNNYYQPSNATATITVQQQPITELPQTPLPASYWTRPIDWQNQLWYSISGNWFGNINQWNMTDVGASTGYGYNAYTKAPLSAHIMWSQPVGGAFGGQIGGINQNDLSNYYTGKSYEQFFNPPVVINGVLYYNKPTGIAPYYGTYAVDLRTGKQLFYMNITGGNSAAWGGITFGQVYTHHNPNEIGGVAYLWGVTGSTYSLYDATTGEWILNIVNATSGTMVMGPNGEILTYSIGAINQTTGWLSMWNSTQCLVAAGNKINDWEYRPLTGGTSLPWSAGLQFNVTVPIFSQVTPARVSIQFVDDGMILVVGSATIQNWEWEAGYSATTGANVWSVNRTIGMIQETSGIAQAQWGGAANGVYVEHNKEIGTYYGFSMLDGKQLWGPTAPDTNPWNPYARNGVSDGSAFYLQGPGQLRVFNVTTGTELWNFTAPSAGLQEASSTYLMEGVNSQTVGGGLVFTGTSNSHGDQLFRGGELYALNTTTGAVVWSIDDFYSQGHAGSNSLADGYLVAFNAYDNQLYCIGQGPSKTTISAPSVGVTTASPIVITGSVTDIAAGTQQDAVASNYPNGLPCVSDASQSQFMEAVYMQQQMPNNVTGVPVTFSVVDSNGNHYDIGTTTTNPSGTYGLTWTPPIPGDYAVTAAFDGTNSYYGSSATTYVHASDASTPTASPLPIAQPSYETYIALASIGTIAAIAIVGALILLAIKKRP
jgi:hypothetical protein